MMTTTNRLYAPTRALPAIAAALALSATPVLAQEAAQPTPPITEPAPATPTVQPTPAPTEPAPATESATPAPAAETPTAATTTTVKQSVKRTTRTASVRPAPVTRTTTRTVTTRAAAPATAAATAKPAATPPPALQAVPAPAVSLNATPSPAKPAAQPATANNMLPTVVGGVLALLLLGGIAALLMGRRRRRREQEWADERTLVHEPLATTAAAPEPELALEEEHVVREPEPAIEHSEPAMAAASAFAWGNQPRHDDTTRVSQPTANADDDRLPGESWVERAYRGPSPNNPSVSLRNRLGRAAFFDKREREAAAGLSAPVDPSAGLPEAMVDEQEREPA